MIRLNIKKDGKVKVKSFIKKDELENYIMNEAISREFIVKTWQDIQIHTNKIWNLNVGTSYIIDNITIAMAGKSRAGMVMLGGK